MFWSATHWPVDSLRGMAGAAQQPSWAGLWHPPPRATGGAPARPNNCYIQVLVPTL